MVAVDRENNVFKRAVIFSVAAHIFLLIIILISPFLPKPSKKGMIHYVNLIAAPGGGGGGGGSPRGTVVNETIAETEVPKRETLRDLTTPQVLEQKEASTFRHPVDKPKREPKAKPDRKAVIQKSQNPSSKETKEDTAAGEGTGVKLGIGPGSGGGGGLGSEFSSQIGLSHFPYMYYLQILQSRISSNWYKSQLKSGSSKDAYTSVFFRIYRDGSISTPNVRESSGIRSLDLSAIRAINSSSPFPPLPQGYEEGYLGITLIFEHSK